MNKILEILGMIFAILAIFTLDKEDKKVKTSEQQSDTRRIIRIYCEKINNINYAWEQDTQKFIGQSDSARELAMMLMNKYPINTYNVIIEEKVT